MIRMTDGAALSFDTVRAQFPENLDISNKLSELKKKKLQVKDALNQGKNKSE